jgi:hypothetical protein
MKHYTGMFGSPVADAMRKAGFVPLPRLWVRPEDIPSIHAIAHPYQDAVTEIRMRVKEESIDYENQNRARKEAERENREHRKHQAVEEPKPEPQPTGPQYDREAAWDAYERMRKQE